MSVFQRCMPVAGEAGRCAVVPAGKSRYPVDVLAWSLTAAGVMLILATVLALLMLLPYAVNVPELVKVWYV
jgi:hypothetical protein